MSTVRSRPTSDGHLKNSKRDRYLLLLGVVVVSSSLVAIALPLIVVLLGGSDAISADVAAVMGSTAAIVTAASVAFVALAGRSEAEIVVVDRIIPDADPTSTSLPGACHEKDEKDRPL